MKPKQTEYGQWEYLGFIINESKHPKLYGNYEIFENNSEENHISRCHTLKGAKRIIDKIIK